VILLSTIAVPTTFVLIVFVLPVQLLANHARGKCAWKAIVLMALVEKLCLLKQNAMMLRRIVDQKVFASLVYAFFYLRLAMIATRIPSLLTVPVSAACV